MRAVVLEREYNIGDRFGIFLCSDLHVDAPEHDRKLLIRELEEAKRMNAFIFIGGDIWDFILSGDRKRYSPSRNKYGDDVAVNHAIDEAYEVLKPYAKNIKVMLCGNHETSMMKFHSIDPTVILICKLNELEGVNIEYLGYSGYIRIRYKYAKGKSTRSFDIFAHHGTGAGAEVTKGTITLNRFMTAHHADLYWTGHTHTKLVLPNENSTFLNRMGRIETKDRKGVITGAYVQPAHHEETTSRGSAKPYKVNYGDTKRSLQSTGGVYLEQEFIGQEEMITRVIS